MIGPLEIAILVVIIFIVLLMGGHKWLPSLGRSAGKGARTGGEKAKQLGATVGEKASEIDTEKIAKAAGDGIREAREVKDALTGKGEPERDESEPEEPGRGESESKEPGQKESGSGSSSLPTDS